jgi:hypothetical protein
MGSIHKSKDPRTTSTSNLFRNGISVAKTQKKRSHPILAGACSPRPRTLELQNFLCIWRKRRYSNSISRVGRSIVTNSSRQDYCCLHPTSGRSDLHRSQLVRTGFELIQWRIFPSHLFADRRHENSDSRLDDDKIFPRGFTSLQNFY